jgi:two-component system CheB/CheR fusion protein
LELSPLAPKDIQVQTKKGAWYLLRIRPYRTIENVIKGAVITFTDIAEIKRAEEILKESESKFRLAVVVHDASDSITMQDLEGHIMAWNPRAKSMFGWSEAEALTMNISSLIPEERRGQELAILKKLSNSEVLEPYHTQRLAKDGRVMDVWLTATSLMNEAGEIYAIATTQREIKSENTKKEGNN